MEDVRFEVVKAGGFVVRTGALAMASHNQIPIHYLGFSRPYCPRSRPACLFCEGFAQAVIYSGFPLWGKTVRETDLINETILNQYGISYTKGCFFGQETPAKINSGRGGNYFPCLIKLENVEADVQDGLKCEQLPSRRIS